MEDIVDDIDEFRDPYVAYEDLNKQEVFRLRSVKLYREDTAFSIYKFLKEQKDVKLGFEICSIDIKESYNTFEKKYDHEDYIYQLMTEGPGTLKMRSVDIEGDFLEADQNIDNQASPDMVDNNQKIKDPNRIAPIEDFLQRMNKSHFMVNHQYKPSENTLSNIANRVHERMRITRDERISQDIEDKLKEIFKEYYSRHFSRHGVDVNTPGERYSDQIDKKTAFFVVVGHNQNIQQTWKIKRKNNLAPMWLNLQGRGLRNYERSSKICERNPANKSD